MVHDDYIYIVSISIAFSNEQLDQYKGNYTVNLR